MSHSEKFDMCLHWRRLQKQTFRDRDFDCKVLMTRMYRVARTARGLGPVLLAGCAFFRQIAYRGLGTARWL